MLSSSRGLPSSARAGNAFLCSIASQQSGLRSSRPSTVPTARSLQLRTTALSFSLLRQFAKRAVGMAGPVDFQVSPEQKWWSSKTTAVVTGGNQGIGLAIAEILARQGLHTILTARRPDAGQQAVEDIKAKVQGAQIEFQPLDISKPDSIQHFAAWAGKELPQLDVLVNNAGFAYKGNAFGAKEAQTTIDTNFLGTMGVCEALVPHMHKGSRIVNICSLAGKQSIIRKKKLLQRFQAAKSIEELNELSREFVHSIEANSMEQEGWPGSMYGVSKLLESTYSKVLAERLAPQGIDVNACCPGYVNTSMSSGRGPKHVTEGADTPCWLALLVPPGTTGGWFTEREKRPF